MDFTLRRLSDAFVPVDEESRELAASIKAGSLVRVKVIQRRNIRFHRKFMAMLRVGYDAWDPAAIEFRGLPVQKNFKRFRKDVTIAAGFYDVYVNIRGEERAEAHSISFENMTEEEFGKLYNAVANVLLQLVLKNYKKDDLEDVVNEIIGFTGIER